MLNDNFFNIFQTLVKKNDTRSLYRVMDHAEKEMEKLKWTAYGWYKARPVEDGSLSIPKGHVIFMTPSTGNGPLVKFALQNEQ